MYKNDTWESKGQDLLTVRLDHGVKALECIKLVGYQISNKRHVGVTHGHEIANDDYFILNIDEVKGNVISNNRHAMGCFAVLMAGSPKDEVVGAVEFHQQDLNGLATHYFDNCNNTVRNLHIRVTDRQGKPAHIGRLHLWFKLHVLHG